MCLLVNDLEVVSLFKAQLIFVGGCIAVYRQDNVICEQTQTYKTKLKLVCFFPVKGEKHRSTLGRQLTIRVK